MTSEEVQSKIFTGVQANPCNTTVDLNKLAEESGDAITMKLAEACAQVNDAETIVKDMKYDWGADVVLLLSMLSWSAQYPTQTLTHDSSSFRKRPDCAGCLIKKCVNF